MQVGTQEDKIKVSLDKDFWDNRYATNEIGWDIGYCSTPLKTYFDQLRDKEMMILIPGCGNAYEAEYLHTLGFKHVYVVDIAPKALERFKQRVPDFPSAHLINADFFELNEKFDLIVEQTFFCAIHPEKRAEYAKKASELLKPQGKLIGVLFDGELNLEHPPFGGTKEEYNRYFSPYFNIEVMERAHNSIAPRADRELFIKLIKK